VPPVILFLNQFGCILAMPLGFLTVARLCGGVRLGEAGDTYTQREARRHKYPEKLEDWGFTNGRLAKKQHE